MPRTTLRSLEYDAAITRSTLLRVQEDMGSDAARLPPAGRRLMRTAVLASFVLAVAGYALLGRRRRLADSLHIAPSYARHGSLGGVLTLIRASSTWLPFARRLRAWASQQFATGSRT